LYGSSVHHCPYCDGWEHRGERLAAYGKGRAAVGLALSLRTWSDRVVACCDGERLSEEDRALAERNEIGVREDGVVRLEGDDGELRRIHFERGAPLECDALFFNTGQVQRSDLPRRLGCSFKDDGGVRTSDRQCTDVPGLYLAGDADKDVQFVIVAAAEGATAAVAMNRELQDEDRGKA
jgi:thioredoxin reductase